MKIRRFWPIQWSTEEMESFFTLKLVSHVPNMIIRISTHWFWFWLRVYAFAQARGRSALPGWNRVFKNSSKFKTFVLWKKETPFISSIRSSYIHPGLLVITTTTTNTPLFQITPVLNTGLSLSEPLQLYKGYNALQRQSLDSSAGHMYTLWVQQDIAAR